jgi:hypothetical protein
MIVERQPQHKDVVVRVIVNLINRDNSYVCLKRTATPYPSNKFPKGVRPIIQYQNITLMTMLYSDVSDVT